MEKFQESLQKMQKMSDAEQKKMLEQLKGMCLCPGCPTYNACMKEKTERLFCVLGKSACIVSMKACLCPGCPVTSKMGLTMTFYCAEGSEAQRRER
ncbi:MAG: DUF2769 domain-containing protein [Methanomicrobiales archaeon]|nr:DUF2769 domain-containing protein [Methanomicrobiales archaeon]